MAVLRGQCLQGTSVAVALALKDFACHTMHGMKVHQTGTSACPMVYGLRGLAVPPQKKGKEPCPADSSMHAAYSRRQLKFYHVHGMHRIFTIKNLCIYQINASQLQKRYTP